MEQGKGILHGRNRRRRGQSLHMPSRNLPLKAIASDFTASMVWKRFVFAISTSSDQTRTRPRITLRSYRASSQRFATKDLFRSTGTEDSLAISHTSTTSSTQIFEPPRPTGSAEPFLTSRRGAQQALKTLAILLRALSTKRLRRTISRPVRARSKTHGLRPRRRAGSSATSLG